MSNNPADIITVDRRTLYQEVWSVPGRTLAQKYGVSDVALAKACSRHQIPRPPRGHWAKLAHGKKVDQVPMPALGDTRLEIVRFHTGMGGVLSFHDPELAAKDNKPSKPPIVVAERLNSPHPLVASTRKHLTQNNGSRHENAAANQHSLNLNVSPKGLPRALRIMDALIKAWESIGGYVRIDLNRSDRTRWQTYFGMGQDQVGVEMNEQQKRIAGNSRWNSEWRYTGHMSIQADHWYVDHLRRKWTDGKRQRLEDIMESIVSGLLKHIDSTKMQRLDNEIVERQSSLAKARREAAKRNKEEREEWRKGLEADADKWQQADLIRRYLAALEERMTDGKLQPKNETGFLRWLTWAHWYADDLDPLTFPEPLPEESPDAPKNILLSEIEFTSYTKPVLERLTVETTDALHQLAEGVVKKTAGDNNSYRVWQEVCRVVEGLGYDVSDRKYWL